MKGHILIVDDEVAIQRVLAKFLAGLGYSVVTAATGAEAVRAAEEHPIDLALVDLVMGAMDGMTCIRQLRGVRPEVVVIVMTGFGSIASAVEAMKVGAFHYLTKPFELEEIARLVATGLEHCQLKEENRQLKQQLKQQQGTHNMIGRSEEMQRIFALIEKVAATDSTVVILGESGTGKELVARAIHFGSARGDRPLVTVNCAAIPEELLETELFGYVKGAFTGAVLAHQGKFEAAHGGTIFLDEIGDMSPKLQVKILRVLQERRFEPVGSTKTVEVDVRIIAATNHDLERAVQERRFREDLFYRLNVIPIKVPPLRVRRTDIPLLARHFVTLRNAANHRAVEGVSEEAMRLLTQYDWPGNVRELEHLIERLVILKEKGVLEVADLPLKVRKGEIDFKAPAMEIPDGGISFRRAVTEFENALILRALQKTGWNKNRAATLLKLNRTTLVEKIKKKHLGRHERAADH